jgi:SAM-dependent methyltransferase
MKKVNKMNNLSYIEIYTKLKKRGFLFIINYILDVWLFDILNGTNTRVRSINNLQNAEYVYYVASYTSVVKNAINVAKNYMGDKFYEGNFIDVGCGKGKVLLIFMQTFSSNFLGKIIGIEYDNKLLEIARKNLNKAMGSKKVLLYEDDALNITNYMSGGCDILFIFNPFTGKTFEDFILNLSSKNHIIIYLDPVEKKTLTNMGYKIIKENNSKLSSYRWLVAHKIVGIIH